ncbi:hypothetical protein J1N35_008710 [Gossypium stocksii]|uniref:Wall-associated receptor kinase galacturonan-binding domain-containing protein n=1 Tax=Gossypium stocksii TaxID=47602 RepID=A0A9D4AER2_9ROSI|nr:hypothetical protein J1N35_008710 [Gossypium stocksii]
MPKPKPQLPIYALVAAIIVLPNHRFQSCVAITRIKYCNATICENVKMSYPFRLPTQPPKCSDHRFELLSDSNNCTVLSLNYCRFYVQSVWYEYFTIRVIDRG